MRLASWDDARTLLADSYDLEELSDRRVRLTVSREESRFEVICDRLETDDQPWLALMIEVAPTREVGPPLAMYVNFEFTVGSLCTYRGRLWMRQTLPIRDTTDLALCEVVETLVDQLADVTTFIKRPPIDNPGFYVPD